MSLFQLEVIKSKKGVGTMYFRHYLSCLLAILLLFIACIASAEEVVEDWRLPGFNWPQDIAINHADNTCWVADSENDRVVHLSETGAILATRTFNHPVGVAPNPNDNKCWVADYRSNRLVQISEDAASELVSIGGFYGMHSPVVDPTDDTCWIANSGTGSIRRYDTSETELVNNSSFTYPYYLTFNPADRTCWAADLDGHNIIQLDSAGAVAFSLGGFYHPTAVAVNQADSSFWVVERNYTLSHFASDGTTLLQIDVVNFPQDISVNWMDGSVWIADSYNDEVTHIAEDGTELWRGGGFEKPWEIEVNPQDGSCWVACRTEVVRLNMPDYTPVGDNVTVTSADGVSITFSEVTKAGNTEVAVSDTPPPGAPSGFKLLGTYYEITTTAEFTGPIQISIEYDDTGIPPNREDNLKIFHADGSGGWQDVTISVDTVNNIITAEVTSFSHFALAWPMYDFLGFVPPMADDSKRIFKRGSTIPVKFNIAEPDGAAVLDAIATLAVYYVGEGAPSDEAEVVSTAAGDWGDQFRYDAEDDLYIFNLSTKHCEWYEWWTFEAVVTLDDGQEFSQTFSLK